MKSLSRYPRATITPGDTREKESLEEPGLTYEKNFFTVSVGQVWNKPQEEVVMAKDVNSFKRLLDKHWKKHPCRYDHEIDPYDLLAS